MAKVLITGATGNVGKEVIKALGSLNLSDEIVAGVRNIGRDKLMFGDMPVHFVPFDFTDTENWKPAFAGVDILFLLRPPQIADVKKYFEPLIEAVKQSKIQHIVFLSVQGAEKNKGIPHHKIEKLIIESGVNYTLLRPAYFMQNFTTTLHDDLTKRKRIFLPAGKAKFTLIDVRDIGVVAAKIISDISPHINKSYELTCSEKLTFGEMASIISRCTGQTITYTSPNLLRFYIAKRKEKIPSMFIFVLIMLHYFPRFQKEPRIVSDAADIMGRETISFKQFVEEVVISANNKL